tara:strand:+ start:82 stop:615 length:534 start_codon:yes stop_codon:yes gene_type:complete
MSNDRSKFWEEALLDVKERLREPIGWYPFPALIAFGLVLILSGHLIPGLNPRLGSRANTINMEAPLEKEGSIWFGIYQDKGDIIVMTSDRKRFRWPKNTTSSKDIRPFTRYLKNRVARDSLRMSLRMEANLTQVTAVLAIDEKLKYIHLTPILYALAEARINKYGFETKVLRSENKL